MNMRLDRHCDLCGKLQEEVFAYEEKHDKRNYVIRAGWVCWACWPKDGAWHKAILRERTVTGGNNVNSTDVPSSDDLSRSPRGTS